jgi:hypothetical protein
MDSIRRETTMKQHFCEYSSDPKSIVRFHNLYVASCAERTCLLARGDQAIYCRGCLPNCLLAQSPVSWTIFRLEYIDKSVRILPLNRTTDNSSRQKIPVLAPRM